MKIFLFFCFFVFWLKRRRNAKQSVNTTNQSTIETSYLNKNVNSSMITSASLENNDNDLTTFVISDNPEPNEKNKTQNKVLGRWIKPNESLKVKNHFISGGYFYFGGQLDSFDSYYGTEASLLDDSLEIEDQPISYKDESLGYWPKYSSLSAKGRGAYLNWLISNRNNSETPIGYVFIYFYGLERRIIVDGKKGDVDDVEYKLLFNEVKRLKSIFKHQSFMNYSTRLLELMCLMRPKVVSFSDAKLTIINNTFLFKYYLAFIVSKNRPIPAKLALAWIKFYPEYQLRTPARRCDAEFSHLFLLRYVQKFPKGFIVKPNKTKLNLQYQPASYAIPLFKIKKNLPDPSILVAPVKKLISIADNCTDTLNSYSRYLSRDGSTRSDVAAILLLPDELANENTSIVIKKFKIWADDNISNNKGLVTFSDFWMHTKKSLPNKINKKENELIQNFVQKIGYGIAPDSRYHFAKPLPNGNLVLFTKGHGAYFEPSTAFQKIEMALRLGVMIANIDTHIDAAELALLHQLIEHDTKLSFTEKNSLQAYLTWRLNAPINMIGLKARLEKLEKNEKIALSHILIDIALADGKIEPSQIKQLEKIYVALGLDKSLVTIDIHRMPAHQKTANASFLNDNLSKVKTSSEPATIFQLDEDILALHEGETKDVQNMLHTIFIDEESQNIVSDISSQNHEQLDVSHQALFDNLITQEKWLRQEVEEQCKKLNLMVDGAIETINDWSFEQVDAPVLEDDDDIFIDYAIVEELKG